MTATDRQTARRRPGHAVRIVVLVTTLVLIVPLAVVFLAGPPSVVHGVFVEGPGISDGRIVNAISLADGRVLVGVAPEEGTVPGTSTLRCTAPCQPRLMLLDPRTGEVTATRETPPSLGVESMALVRDGRVLLVSAFPETGAHPSASIYDPATDRFETTGDPTEARSWPFLITLADGRVLVGGGQAASALSTTELLDPATGTFSAAGSMARPRSIGVTATRLEDGRVLVVGGGADVGPSAELFDPATGDFTPTGPMTVARGGFHSATLLADGRVLLVGGLVPNPADPQTVPDATASAEVYDPRAGTFAAVGSMAAPRFGHAASILADGSVLVAGGAHVAPSGVPVAVGDAEIFDPGTGAFRATGSLVRPRFMSAAVGVDGRVLVFGHADPTGGSPVTGATTEWFD